MPICIECRYPVPQLYHVLQGASSKAASSGLKPAVNASDSNSIPTSTTPAEVPAKPSLASVNDGSRSGGEASQKTRTAGSDVRLTQCPRCKKFADKYVEHDFVVLFIDLVLVKPQVYRHLLINRLDVSLRSAKDHFDPAILRLALLLTLFDVYITWSRIEALPAERTASSPIPSWSILSQYLYFIALSIGGTSTQHLVIRLLAWLPLLQNPDTANVTAPRNDKASDGKTFDQVAKTNPQGSPESQQQQSWIWTFFRSPAPNSGIAISTALIVSSCMKLFPILMVVWKYDDASGQLARGVQLAVAIQNLEALRVVLGLIYWQAALLVFAGHMAEDAVAHTLLYLGGLGGVSVGWGVNIGYWIGGSG